MALRILLAGIATVVISSRTGISYAGGSCYVKIVNGKMQKVGDCGESNAPTFNMLKSWYRASNGRFYKLFKTLVDYATAKSNCKKEGARLASAGMRDTEIRQDLIRRFDPGDTDFYIGLEETAEEGKWLWSDGVIIGVTDSVWNVGEPSSDYEKCGTIRYRLGANDGRCSTKLFYLCEY